MDYLLTWTTYGSWLHGDQRWSVDRHHRSVGTPAIPPNAAWHSYERSLLREPPFELSGETAVSVIQALRETCNARGWFLFAAHVRTSHLHVVVRAAADGSVVLNALKANATRQLKQRIASRRLFWTRSGSIRRLQTEEALSGAIRYVVDGQGRPMKLFLAELANA